VDEKKEDKYFSVCPSALSDSQHLYSMLDSQGADYQALRLRQSSMMLSDPALILDQALTTHPSPASNL